MRKNSNGWLKMNFMDGLSTRIKTDFIQQIEIENDVIRICLKEDREWIVVRRYNSEVIKVRFEEANRCYHDIFAFDDSYFGKGSEDRKVREAVEQDQEYLKVLGEGGNLPKGK